MKLIKKIIALAGFTFFVGALLYGAIDDYTHTDDGRLQISPGEVRVDGVRLATTAEVAAVQDNVDLASNALHTAITAEVERATLAEGANYTLITAEVERATTAEGANYTLITAEVDRATTAEGVNYTAITAEVERATIAEGLNYTAITAEVERATIAEGVNYSAITAEVDRASSSELVLSGRVDTLEGQTNDYGTINGATIAAGDSDSVTTNSGILNFTWNTNAVPTTTNSTATNFGIGSGDAYRGDWGDGNSNRIVDLENATNALQINKLDASATNSLAVKELQITGTAAEGGIVMSTNAYGQTGIKVLPYIEVTSLTNWVIDPDVDPDITVSNWDNVITNIGCVLTNEKYIIPGYVGPILSTVTIGLQNPTHTTGIVGIGIAKDGMKPNTIGWFWTGTIKADTRTAHTSAILYNDHVTNRFSIRVYNGLGVVATNSDYYTPNPPTYTIWSLKGLP